MQELFQVIIIQLHLEMVVCMVEEKVLGLEAVVMMAAVV
jgi:hypothetical protein